MSDLCTDLGPPAGFPNCQQCPYVINGPVPMCVRCATATIEPIVEPRCTVCSQRLQPGGECRNTMCQRPRYIRQIHAIAAHSGELRTTIARLKYHGGTGWALIFGRLVMGWLNANLQPWDVDLIVANPTYVGAAVQHTEEVLRSAKREDVRDVWPFRPELLRLARPLPTSAGTSIAAKEAKAEALYHALWLGDRAAVSDKRMIVYDDVCTTGLQLNVAARFLHEQGARSVDGLVLARALWR